MSVETLQRNNVLPFKRHARPAMPQESAASQLQEILGVYDQLIALLRQTYDEGLDSFTDSLVISVVHCREALLDGVEEAEGQLMLRKLRAELREIPRTLRSILPGIGPRLGESMQQRLGIQFAKY